MDDTSPPPAVLIQGLSKRFDLRRRRGPLFLSMQRASALGEMLGRPLKRSRRKDELWALRDIDLEVGRGEVLGIIGRNGAGKSTLLKILARIIRPTSGRAELHGQVASLLEMGMGFDRKLTVRDNVFMYGLMNNVPEEEAMARIEDIACLARLEDHLDTPLHHCPSGSYIRLAFSAVIHLRADIILADEVLAVGDAAFQAECIEQIREGSEAGKSVLFVSHDLEAILHLCHRVVWLDKGRIVEIGNPATVVTRYRETLLGLAPDQARAAPHKDDEPESVIEHIQLLSGTGAEIGALGMGMEGSLEFLVRIGFGVQQFRIHAACYQDGRLVLALSQPACQVGSTRYRVRLYLPAHYFNELRYEVRAVLEITKGGRNRYIEGEKRLAFSVYNTRAEDSAWGDWPWGRPGYICPRLDWQVRRTSVQRS